MITTRRLEEIEGKCAGVKVAVLGDLILDEFLVGTVERISPEAPVPVLEYSSHSYELGGAGNAARTVARLRGEALLVGVTGSDQAGQALLSEALTEGIGVDGVVVAAKRSTTLKTRVIAQGQQVVRIDREASGGLGSNATRELRDAVADAVSAADALLVSDYDKGGLPVAIVRDAMKAADAASIPVVVDTKTVHAVYKGASVLTPNLGELARMSRMNLASEGAVEKAARAVLKRLEPEALLVTRAEAGMSLFTKVGERIDIEAIASQVHDVTGAGDTVAATLALALGAGVDLVEAARLATLAAAVVVRKVGTAAPEWGELSALAKS